MRVWIVALATGSLLGGCASTNSLVRPQVAMPDSFRNAPSGAAASVQDGTWWRAFGDPVLDQLVDAALQGNFDIEIARARLAQAAAGVRAARGAALPQVAVTGDAAAQRLSLESPTGAIASRIPGFERTVEQYGLNAAAAWEVDLFGRMSSATRAATADAQVAAAGLAGARLTVAAEVANAYIAVRELQARIAIAEDQKRTLAQVDALTALSAARGILAVTAADRTRAEAAIVRASIPALRAALEVEANRLDILLGRMPGRALADLGAGNIPEPPRVAAGEAPAALLRNRPDVVVAERSVAAADARVAEAIASYYPRLSLSGLAGFLSNGLAGLLTGGTLQVGGGANIVAPIFAGGQLRANEDRRRAQLDEAVATYRQIALVAVGECENALSALTNRGEQASQFQTAALALDAASGRARIAHRAGVSSLFNVLDVERQLLTARDGAAIAQAEKARAAVAVFRAFGGGWTGLVPG